jgi:branched-chain amino acid transport system ATP-binding protein
VLKVEGLCSGYGKLQILSDVSIEGSTGKLTVIVGPNGSGKSTLLKTISGLTRVYSGTISLNDKMLTGLPPHVIARSGVAYLPQTESTFPLLTVAENFRMAAITVERQDFEARLNQTLEMFPQLRAYMKSKVLRLSGGERQMVAMGMALVRKPQVIMFDEPTSNLSPKLATEVLGKIASCAKEMELIVLLVEQNARKALEIGDNAYLLVGGKKAFEGTAHALLSHQELGKLYLGMKLVKA